MTKKERLRAVFTRQDSDRTPILGGWIACPDHICTICGVDLDAYWKDPVAYSVAAYRRLGSDGLIDVFVPKSRDDFRCVDADTYQHAVSAMSLEDAVQYIDEHSG